MVKDFTEVVNWSDSARHRVRAYTVKSSKHTLTGWNSHYQKVKVWNHRCGFSLVVTKSVSSHKKSRLSFEEVAKYLKNINYMNK